MEVGLGSRSQQWTSRHHWTIVGHLWYNKCCQGNVWVYEYTSVCVCVCAKRVAILMCVLFMKIHFCIHSTATKNVDHKVFCILFSVFLFFFAVSFAALLLLFMYKFFFSFVFGFVWVWTCPFPARRLTHGWRLSRSAKDYQWCSMLEIAHGAAAAATFFLQISVYRGFIGVELNWAQHTKRTLDVRSLSHSCIFPRFSAFSSQCLPAWACVIVKLALALMEIANEISF